MRYRVYISASTQKENIGVGQYGTEQDRMQALADRIKYWLSKQNIEVIRNQPGWTLEQTVAHCNSLVCDLFIDNHSNAGPVGADGTEVYHHNGSVKGKALATVLNDFVAPVSPGSDRGVLVDTSVYNSGFYVLRATTPPAALIEHIYHTDATEVSHFIANSDKYAKATAQAVCKFLGVSWTEPQTDIEILVDKLLSKKAITDKQYWLSVLNGTKSADPEYLKIVFTRLLA